VTNVAVVSSLTPGIGGKPITAVDSAEGRVVSKLPASGADSWMLLRSACLLLLVGAGGLVLARRRRLGAAASEDS
jgi:hypothetical protein